MEAEQEAPSGYPPGIIFVWLAEAFGRQSVCLTSQRAVLLVRGRGGGKVRSGFILRPPIPVRLGPNITGIRHRAVGIVVASRRAGKCESNCIKPNRGSKSNSVLVSPVALHSGHSAGNGNSPAVGELGALAAEEALELLLAHLVPPAGALECIGNERVISLPLCTTCYPLGHLGHVAVDTLIRVASLREMRLHGAKEQCHHQKQQS